MVQESEGGYTSDAAAICLALIASILSVGGVNICKWAHTKIEHSWLRQQTIGAERSERQPYITSPHWWLGFWLVVIGAVGDFAAFGIGQVTIVAAIGGATTLTGNVVIARYMLHEPLWPSDGVGVACVIASALIIALSAPGQWSGTYQELFHLWLDPVFLTYCVLLVVSMLLSLSFVAGSSVNKAARRVVMGIVGPVVVGLQQQFVEQQEQIVSLKRDLAEMRTILSVRLECNVPSSGGSGDKASEGDPVALADARLAKAFSRTPQLVSSAALQASSLADSSVERQQLRNELHVAVADTPGSGFVVFATCSGIFGATSVLLSSTLGKCVVALLGGDESVVSHWEMWVVAVGMIVTVIVQTSMLNDALRMADAICVYPIFQAFWTGFSTLGGIMLYEQANGLSPGQWFLYLVAGALTLFGVLQLSKHPSKASSATSGSAMVHHYGPTSDPDFGVGHDEEAVGLLTSTVDCDRQI